jgi:hypothetical protein
MPCFWFPLLVSFSSCTRSMWLQAQSKTKYLQSLQHHMTKIQKHRCLWFKIYSLRCGLAYDDVALKLPRPQTLQLTTWPGLRRRSLEVTTTHPIHLRLDYHPAYFHLLPDYYHPSLGSFLAAHPNFRLAVACHPSQNHLLHFS